MRISKFKMNKLNILDNKVYQLILQNGHCDYVTSISVKNNFLFTIDAGGIVKIWSIKPFELIKAIKAKPAVVLVANDEYLFIGSKQDEFIKVLNLYTGNFIEDLNTEQIGIYAMIATPHLLYVSSLDKILIYDISNKKLLKSTNLKESITLLHIKSNLSLNIMITKQKPFN